MNVVSRDDKFFDKVLNGICDHFKHVFIGVPVDANQIVLASDTSFGRSRDYSVMRRNVLPQELFHIYDMANHFEPYNGKRKAEGDEELNDFIPAHILKQKGQNKNKKKNGN